MATCPFCASQVTADLVTYGGTCPKCFAEVPGEEAPTDPGAEVRAAQLASDRRRNRVRALIFTSVLGMAVVCMGIVVVSLIFWPTTEIAEIEFDELDMARFEFVGADDAPDGELTKVDPNAVAEAPEPAQPKQPKPGTEQPKPESVKPDSDKPETVKPDAPKPASDLATSMADKFKSDKLDLPDGDVKIGGDERRGTTGTRGPRGLDGPAPDAPADLKVSTQRGAGANSLDLDPLEGKVGRRKPTLTDESEIRETMASRMRVLAPNLNRCYEKELKANPTLSGRWEIAFVVLKTGRATGATARGLTTKDAKFEACMVGIMNRWSGFYPMNQDKKVKRTLNFRPR